MKHTFREEGDIVIVELSGKIMGETADSSITKIVYDYTKQNKVKFIFDFCNVEWMNSRGLGLLIAGATTARDKGGDLKLACACGKVKELLDTTHMFAVFKCYDSLEEAMKSFQSNTGAK